MNCIRCCLPFLQKPIKEVEITVSEENKTLYKVGQVIKSLDGKDEKIKIAKITVDNKKITETLNDLKKIEMLKQQLLNRKREVQEQNNNK